MRISLNWQTITTFLIGTITALFIFESAFAQDSRNVSPKTFPLASCKGPNATLSAQEPVPSPESAGRIALNDRYPGAMPISGWLFSLPLNLPPKTLTTISS
jgi:hypothetical protein